MCEPVTAAVAVSAAAGAYSQYQQGQAAGAAARANSQNLLEQAKQEEEAGELQRQQIRESGAQMIGQGRAAFASRGADVSFGTPVYWQVGAEQEVQADAAAAATTTERRAGAARFQSAITRAEGRSARRAGAMGAFTSLVGGAGRSAYTYNQMNP